MFINLWYERKSCSSTCVPCFPFLCSPSYFPLLLRYLVCSFPNESSNSLLLCFASMSLSLSAPDNTLILPPSSSKSLNLCSSLILLLLHFNCFSKNLLWDKMWGHRNLRLPTRRHLPGDIWYIQTWGYSIYLNLPQQYLYTHYIAFPWSSQ